MNSNGRTKRAMLARVSGLNWNKFFSFLFLLLLEICTSFEQLIVDGVYFTIKILIVNLAYPQMKCSNWFVVDVVVIYYRKRNIRYFVYVFVLLVIYKIHYGVFFLQSSITMDFYLWIWMWDQFQFLFCCCYRVESELWRPFGQFFFLLVDL